MILWTRFFLHGTEVPVCRFKVKCVFMHNNGLLHVSKLTREVLEYKRFSRKQIMEWQLSSSDQNPMKNLWSVVKMKYEGSKQYNSNADLREAIKTIMPEIEPAQVKESHNQWILDYWRKRRVSILKCKEFKNLSCLLIVPL